MRIRPRSGGRGAVKQTPETFWARVDSTAGLFECWPWTGSTFQVSGYGQVTADGKTYRAHRLAYIYAVGDPGQLHIDHLCRNPICCNPSHLEAVSRGENSLRGESPPALNARKTHCVRGHPFDEANTRYTKDGYRSCRTCERERCRACRQRQRERQREARRAS